MWGLSQEWEPPNVGEFCCGFAPRSGVPQNLCGFGSGCAPSSGMRALEFMLCSFCCVSAPRSGVGVPRRFWCGSALCSEVCVPKSYSGSTPHSEVGAPKFGRVLMWFCLLITCGRSKIQESSGVDLPLTPEWESHNSGEFYPGSAPRSGEGAPKFGMVLVWVCPSLRTG